MFLTCGPGCQAALIGLRPTSVSVATCSSRSGCSDRRLDQAGAVVIARRRAATSSAVTRVLTRRAAEPAAIASRTVRSRRRMRCGDRLAHQRAQFLLGHSLTSTVIDDADDRRVNGRALAAERLAGGAPFEHDQHLLVHAGADASTASSAAPRGVSSSVSGCTSSSFAPSNLRCFCVDDDGADDTRADHASTRSLVVQ